MDNFPLVILANEPDSYRSLLAAELPFLRPNLRVLEVEPAELDATVIAYHPAVVISSRALEFVSAPPCSILILRAEEVDSSIESCDEVIDNPRLSDILQAIDRALEPSPSPGEEAPRSGPVLAANTPPPAPYQAAPAPRQA